MHSAIPLLHLFYSQFSSAEKTLLRSVCLLMMSLEAGMSSELDWGTETRCNTLHNTSITSPPQSRDRVRPGHSNLWGGEATLPLQEEGEEDRVWRVLQASWGGGGDTCGTLVTRVWCKFVVLWFWLKVFRVVIQFPIYFLYQYCGYEYVILSLPTHTHTNIMVF